MITVTRVDILTVELPFRFSFGHALAKRRSSTNVLVRLTLDDGTIGYGEGVPREYVTGETVDGAVEALGERLVPAVLGHSFAAPAAVPAAVGALAGAGPRDLAARCALELALLDACGKSFNVSVRSWMGSVRAPVIVYDAIIPFSSPTKLAALALVARAAGLRNFKMKVGADLEAELDSLRVLRRVLGSAADLRVDANCGWRDADEALEAISRMRRFGISAVEQPLPAGDFEGLRKVTAETPESIIVDESLCTLDDATRLAGERACDVFNIRVSKCGGLLTSMRMAEIARDAGLGCVVGAQVGETGLLSAAGRHAAAVIDPRWVEGSAGSLLLKEDLTVERVLPGWRGRARPFDGPGLGVSVRDDVIRTRGTIRRTLDANVEPVR